MATADDVTYERVVPDVDPGKVVVSVVINVEVFLPGRGGPAIQPHLQSKPEVANNGWRDYGNKRGLARLLRALEAQRLPCTAVVNSDIVTREPETWALLCATPPDLVEIAAHGRNNTEGLASLSAEAEAADVQETLDTLNAALTAAGREPIRTWLTPGFSVTERTTVVLAAAGVRTTLDYVDDDVGVLRRGVAPKATPWIACVPYCLETNDITLCLTSRFTAADFGRTLLDHVTQLHDEAPHTSSVVCLGLHTFIAGTPSRALHLSRALAGMKALPQVSFQACCAVGDALLAKAPAA